MLTFAVSANDSQVSPNRTSRRTTLAALGETLSEGASAAQGQSEVEQDVTDTVHRLLSAAIKLSEMEPTKTTDERERLFDTNEMPADGLGSSIMDTVKPLDDIDQQTTEETVEGEDAPRNSILQDQDTASDNDLAPAGSFQDHDLAPAGSFQDHDLAPAGSFQDHDTAPDNDLVPAGSFQDHDTAPDNDLAPAGSFQDHDTAPDNDLAPDNNPAPAGSFQDHDTAPDNDPAPAGSFQDHDTAPDNDPAPAGSFQDHDTAPDNDLAPDSSFQDHDTAPDNDLVPAGSFQDHDTAPDNDLAPDSSFQDHDTAPDNDVQPLAGSVLTEDEASSVKNQANDIAEHYILKAEESKLLVPNERRSTIAGDIVHSERLHANDDAGTEINSEQESPLQQTVRAGRLRRFSVQPAEIGYSAERLQTNNALVESVAVPSSPDLEEVLFSDLKQGDMAWDGKEDHGSQRNSSGKDTPGESVFDSDTLHQHESEPQLEVRGVAMKLTVSPFTPQDIHLQLDSTDYMEQDVVDELANARVSISSSHSKSIDDDLQDFLTRPDDNVMTPLNLRELEGTADESSRGLDENQATRKKNPENETSQPETGRSDIYVNADLMNALKSEVSAIPSINFGQLSHRSVGSSVFSCSLAATPRTRIRAMNEQHRKSLIFVSAASIVGIMAAFLLGVHVGRKP